MKIKDILFFRTLLATSLFQLFFWIGSVACLLTGIVDLFYEPLLGLMLIFLGPLFLRLVCEYLIVLFRINNTLTEIKEMLLIWRGSSRDEA